MIEKNIAEILEKRIKKYQDKYSCEDITTMKSVLYSYKFYKISIIQKLRIFCDASIIPDDLKIPAKRLYKEFSSI